MTCIAKSISFISAGKSPSSSELEDELELLDDSDELEESEEDSSRLEKMHPLFLLEISVWKPLFYDGI